MSLPSHAQASPPATTLGFVCPDPAIFSSPGQATYTVPEGVSRISIRAYGAEGGAADGEAGAAAGGNADPGVGGLGGSSTGMLDVSPGAIFTIYVGGRGGNGGNAGGAFGPPPAVAATDTGGGGASWVELNGSAILVAGGDGTGPRAVCWRCGDPAGSLGGDGDNNIFNGNGGGAGGGSGAAVAV